MQCTLMAAGLCLATPKWCARHSWETQWQWPRQDSLVTGSGEEIRLDQLPSQDDAGRRAQHQLREALRVWWWTSWDSTRSAHQGIASGIDREVTLTPLRHMQTGKQDFGSDGTLGGARYARFLADALWSRFRLHQAGLVSSPCCLRCEAGDEHVLHFLWHCKANGGRLEQLRHEWRQGARPGSLISADLLPDALPLCLRQCGVVPLDWAGCSEPQLHALQRYFVAVLREWGLGREGEEAEGL